MKTNRWLMRAACVFSLCVAASAVHAEEGNPFLDEPPPAPVLCALPEPVAGEQAGVAALPPTRTLVGVIGGKKVYRTASGEFEYESAASAAGKESGQ